MTMNLYDKFTFGKFKGLTLKKVMAEHSSYVGWCFDNMPNFHIEPKKMEEQFLKAYDEWKQTHKGMVVRYSHLIKD